MPGVEDGVAALGHEEHAEVGLTGSEHARRTVLVHQAHEMDIVGKLAARYERPAATQPEPPCVVTARPVGRVEPANNRLESPNIRARAASSKKRDQKAGQRVVPNEPGHRRFGARQRLENTQPLLRCVLRGCASVEEHATQVALANSLHNRFGDTPVILGYGTAYRLSFGRGGKGACQAEGRGGGSLGGRRYRHLSARGRAHRHERSSDEADRQRRLPWQRPRR